ncbi:hypothetical protein BC629DRAFT_875037 [Irpex lacteus]|nr:hypothetical protein BC629DRAFT_875037 [Irpex lacteus]
MFVASIIRYCSSTPWYLLLLLTCLVSKAAFFEYRASVTRLQLSRHMNWAPLRPSIALRVQLDDLPAVSSKKLQSTVPLALTFPGASDCACTVHCIPPLQSLCAL